MRVSSICRTTAGIGACVLAASTVALAQEWKPAKNVDIVVASGAGGSSDRTARVVQRLLQANPAFPSVSVTHRPGGGTVAWTYLAQHPGDPHFIATFSPTMITNHILGIGKLSYTDFTPLSILLREYVVVTVGADSPIASGPALIERLREDPTAVSFAFSAAPGNHNHVVIGMLMKAAGADPKKAKIVIQKSGGAGATAVLGGHIDVLVGAPGSVLPHLQSGKMRILGVAAPQRQPGALAAVPTFREQGIDALFFSWRGFIGAKDLTAAQIAFWDQAFALAVQAEEWKKDLEKNAWAEDLMGSAETRRHLDHEQRVMTKMLAELGVVAK
jgi:putative tricarboxylic transport membrane protein